MISGNQLLLIKVDSTRRSAYLCHFSTLRCNWFCQLYCCFSLVSTTGLAINTIKCGIMFNHFGNLISSSLVHNLPTLYKIINLNPPITFRVILLTYRVSDRQTDRQTNGSENDISNKTSGSYFLFLHAHHTSHR